MLTKIAAFFAAKKILLINIAIAVAAVMFTGSFVSLSVLAANESKRSKDVDAKLETLLNGGGGDLSDIREKLNELLQNQNNSAVDGKLNAIQNQLNALSGDINTKVLGVNGELAAVQTALSAQIGTIKTALETVQSALEGQITEVTETLEGLYAEAAAAIENDADEGEVSALLEKIEYFKDLKENLAALQTSVNDKFTALNTSLASKETELRNFIDVAIDEFLDLKGDVSAIASDFAAAKEDVTDFIEDAITEYGVIRAAFGTTQTQLLGLANDAIAAFGALSTEVDDLQTAFTAAQTQLTALGNTAVTEFGNVKTAIAGLTTKITAIETTLATVTNMRTLLDDATLQINKDLLTIKTQLGLITADNAAAILAAQTWVPETVDGAVNAFYADFETGDIADDLGYTYAAWFGKDGLTGIDLLNVQTIDALRLNLSRVINIETENLTKKVKDAIWAKLQDKWIEDAGKIRKDKFDSGEYFTAQLDATEKAVETYIKGLKYTDAKDADGDGVLDNVGSEVEAYYTAQFAAISTMEQITNGLEAQINTFAAAYYGANIQDTENVNADEDLSVIDYVFATWFPALANPTVDTDIDAALENVLVFDNATPKVATGITYALKLKIYIAASDYWMSLINAEKTRIEKTKAYDQTEINTKFGNISGLINAVKGTYTINTSLADLASAFKADGAEAAFNANVALANGTIINNNAVSAYTSLTKNSTATVAFVNGLVQTFYNSVDDDNNPGNQGVLNYINYDYDKYFGDAANNSGDGLRYKVGPTEIRLETTMTNAEYEAAFKTIYNPLIPADPTVVVTDELTDGAKTHIYGRVKYEWKQTLKTEIDNLVTISGELYSASDIAALRADLNAYIDALNYTDTSDINGNGILDHTGTDVRVYCEIAVKAVEIDTTKIAALYNTIQTALYAFYDLWIHDSTSTDKLSQIQTDLSGQSTGYGYARYKFEKWFGNEVDAGNAAFVKFADLTYDTSLTGDALIAERVRFIEALQTVWNGTDVTDQVKQFTFTQTKIAWKATVDDMFYAFKNDIVAFGFRKYNPITNPEYSYLNGKYYADMFAKLETDIKAYFDTVTLDLTKPAPANDDERLGKIAAHTGVLMFQAKEDLTKANLQEFTKTAILDAIKAYYGESGKYLNDSSTTNDDYYDEYLWLDDEAYTGGLDTVYKALEGVYGYAGSYWFKEIVDATTYYGIEGGEAGFAAAAAKFATLTEVRNAQGALTEYTAVLTDATKQKVLDRAYSQWTRYFNEALNGMTNTTTGIITVPAVLGGGTEDKTYWADDASVIAAKAAILAEFRRILTIGTLGADTNNADGAREFYTDILKGGEFTPVGGGANLTLVTIASRRTSAQNTLETALKNYYATIYDINDSYNKDPEYFGYAYATWFVLGNVNYANANSYTEYEAALSAFVSNGQLVANEKIRVYNAAKAKWLASLGEAYNLIKANYYYGDINPAYQAAYNYINAGAYSENPTVTGTTAREYAETLLGALTLKATVISDITTDISALEASGEYYPADITALRTAAQNAYDTTAETATAASVWNAYLTLKNALVSTVDIAAVFESKGVEADYYAADWAVYTAEYGVLVDDANNDKKGAEVKTAVEALVKTMISKADVEAFMESKLGEYNATIAAELRPQAEDIIANATTAAQAIEDIKALCVGYKTVFDENRDAKLDSISDGTRKTNVQNWTNELLTLAGENVNNAEIQNIIMRFMNEAHAAWITSYVTEGPDAGIGLSLLGVLDGGECWRVPSGGYLNRAKNDIRAVLATL